MRYVYELTSLKFCPQTQLRPKKLFALHCKSPVRELLACATDETF